MTSGLGLRPPVVAIDGPAGVGKSTAARLLAQELGLPYLDTGAMYRAVAIEALQRGLDPDDTGQVAALAATMAVDLVLREDGSAQVTLRGIPPGAALRQQEVGEMASRLAARPEVRRRLVALQRKFGATHGAVLEGRDIGTVVFPEARCKFFLDARPEIRVRRRAEQLRASGQDPNPEALAAEVDRRDARDRERSDSPLRADETYVTIDSSDLDAEEVVALMLRFVRQVDSGA